MVKKIALVIVFVLIAIQVVPVDKTNPEETAPMVISDMQVKSILDRSCMDCHSNNTVWPWYSNIAPFSWKISEHVVEGRDELNFSDWGNYSTKKAIHKLEEIVEEVKEGHMPEDGYVLIHSDAKISDADLAVLQNWVTNEIALLKQNAPTEEMAPVESEGSN
jgi:cytochrome c551/c552